ncbi:protein dispatched homolog 1-like isoform X3 [Chrysemys picta bellii]|uniref:protein dispatched homolog 1-like isoform X3 n=1 Tax=Chrysemys picta bellii TaxID=8478 RepID=UPI0032B2E387
MMPSNRPARPFKLPKSYAALIADWPVVVLGMCTVLIVVCALVGILVPDLPDFSDPLLFWALETLNFPCPVGRECVVLFYMIRVCLRK